MARFASPQPALSWVVVGQGAIGLLAASRMALSGQAVSLWLRQPATVNIDYIQPPLSHQIQFLPAIAPLTAVLLPVKSYAVATAMQQLLPHLSHDAQLVLSHNGMGTIEQVLMLLGPQQGLWFLTTTHGALRHNNGVTHSGQGQSVLAPLNAGALPYQAQVQDAMHTALGPLSNVDDIRPFLWQKLAINAVINPLTALNNCRNGELVQPQYQTQIDGIVKEVCLVSRACGYELFYQATLEKIHQVIVSTAQNFSSMHQDVVHQRRTEIDAINGYIVQQAHCHNIAVPHNTALLQQVLLLHPGT